MNCSSKGRVCTICWHFICVYVCVYLWPKWEQNQNIHASACASFIEGNALNIGKLNIAFIHWPGHWRSTNRAALLCSHHRTPEIQSGMLTSTLKFPWLLTIYCSAVCLLLWPLNTDTKREHHTCNLVRLHSNHSFTEAECNEDGNHWTAVLSNKATVKNFVFLFLQNKKFKLLRNSN